jgi:hypothetical protein
LTATGALRCIKLADFGLSCAESIHAQSDTNSVEVTAEGAVVSQASNFTKSLNESLLRNILGFVAITQEVGCGAIESVAVTIN